jgi:ubiquinone/menaquinone biosynthesis C-methylase UbiE
LSEEYVPPLRFRALTPIYDWVVAWSSAERRFRQALVELVAEGDPATIVEVGCGTGSLVRLLAARHPRARVLGLDADRDALAIAASKPGNAGVTFVRGDARALPLRTASRDAVVTSLFFHHLDDAGKAQVLGEIRRVLRPAGRLLVGDWDAPEGLGSRIGFQAVRWLDGHANTQAHAAGEFPAILSRAGFRVEGRGRLQALAGTLGLWEARAQ